MVAVRHRSAQRRCKRSWGLIPKQFTESRIKLIRRWGGDTLTPEYRRKWVKVGREYRKGSNRLSLLFPGPLLAGERTELVGVIDES